MKRKSVIKTLLRFYDKNGNRLYTIDRVCEDEIHLKASIEASKKWPEVAYYETNEIKYYGSKYMF